MLDVDGPWETVGDSLPYTASLGDLVVFKTKLFDADGILTDLSWKIKARGAFDDYDDRFGVIRANYSGIPIPIDEGGLDDGTPFRGRDKIRVIDKGNKPAKNAAKKNGKK